MSPAPVGAHRAHGRRPPRGQRRLRRFTVTALAGLLGGSALAATAAHLPGRSGAPAAVRTAARPVTRDAVPPTTPLGRAGVSLPADAPAAHACIARILRGLSRQDLAGQVVMAGVPADDPASAASTVRRQRLGGVFLAGRSHASPTSVRRAVDELRTAVGRELPLHVAADQEGGAVQTLEGAEFTDIPPAVQQGQWAPGRLAERTRRWAGPLARAGVTLDFAPIADTVPPGTAAANPPIGAFGRQFGGSAVAVAADVAVVVRTLQENHVQATVKHFPGLGRVRVNPDSAGGAVDRVATADDPHLAPFRAAIAVGVGAVMVSSASYPQLDDRSIAAFSRPIVTGLLRDRLRFGGLIVSDDLGAAGAVRAVPVGQRAVRFVAAGGDLVLTVRLDDAPTMARALDQEARRSPAFARRLGEAARHVLESKARAGLLPCAIPTPAARAGH
jgi:beta-N-acetylhexosaminidase